MSFLKKIWPRTAGAYWKKLGPGLTTGAADDDPAGIATYSEAGARYGFQLLWLALLSFPLMAIVQEMCARIGMVTGRGLAGNIRHSFPRPVLYISTILLFGANTFNIGADLGAMAKAVELLQPRIPFSLLVIGFALFSLLFQIFTSYQTYASFLKWLALILFAYVFTAFMIDLPWRDVLYHTLVPAFTFSKDTIVLIAAILGTTISPYLFFWQTSQEVEEKILHGELTLKQREHTSKREIADMRLDVWSGMFISNLVMFFIITVCGATLFSHGITTIKTAADAAIALRPLAGQGAYLLFALGIIGTGLLAVPVLAGSASYAISECFGWTQGLNKKFHEATAFYIVLTIAMLVGLLFNFTNVDPIQALIYSAVANCLVAPVVLVLIVLLSSNRAIMKEQVNKPVTAFLGWLVVLIMLAASIATLVTLA